MRAGRIATVALLAALAAGCAGDGSAKGSDAMFGTLMKLIPKSSAVAFARLGPTTKTTVQGQKMLRVSAEVLENFRGLRAGAAKFDLLVPDEVVNDYETPGREVVVLLSAEGGAYRVTDYSSLLDVPTEGREEFLRCIRESVAAAYSMGGAAARRAHVLNMLQSGIEFFQQDAARSAADMKGYTDAEIETMIALIKGDEKRKPVTGLTRDKLIPAVVKNAPVPRAASFGKEILLDGGPGGVYSGLDARDPKEAEAVVKAFLEDPEEKVRAAGLLVAGMLRRGDLLDAFAARYSPDDPAPPAIEEALAKAREYVDREL